MPLSIIGSFPFILHYYYLLSCQWWLIMERYNSDPHNCVLDPMLMIQLGKLEINGGERSVLRSRGGEVAIRRAAGGLRSTTNTRMNLDDRHVSSFVPLPAANALIADPRNPRRSSFLRVQVRRLATASRSMEFHGSDSRPAICQLRSNFTNS